MWDLPIAPGLGPPGTPSPGSIHPGTITAANTSSWRLTSISHLWSRKKGFQIFRAGYLGKIGSSIGPHDLNFGKTQYISGQQRGDHAFQEVLLPGQVLHESLFKFEFVLKFGMLRFHNGPYRSYTRNFDLILSHSHSA